MRTIHALMALVCSNRYTIHLCVHARLCVCSIRIDNVSFTCVFMRVVVLAGCPCKIYVTCICYIYTHIHAIKTGFCLSLSLFLSQNIYAGYETADGKRLCHAVFTSTTKQHYFRTQFTLAHPNHKRARLTRKRRHCSHFAPIMMWVQCNCRWNSTRVSDIIVICLRQLLWHTYCALPLSLPHTQTHSEWSQMIYVCNIGPILVCVWLCVYLYVYRYQF